MTPYQPTRFAGLGPEVRVPSWRRKVEQICVASEEDGHGHPQDSSQMRRQQVQPFDSHIRYWPESDWPPVILIRP